MTRILRLLLIAAVALPLWQSAAAESVTVCGSTPHISSEFLPVYGYWMDTQGVETQMIYPSSMFKLEGNGKNRIDAITFYCKTTVPAALGGKTVIVRMGETYNTTISSRSEMITNRNSMEIVYQGELTTGATEMTIEFTTPYVYQGNNLMIDFYVKENSDVVGQHCNWIGEVTQENTAWNSKDGGETFLPKMTLTYSANQQVVVDFEKKSVGSTTTKTIDVANVTAYTLSPTQDEDNPIFKVTKSGDTFTIIFKPAEAASYTGFLTVTVNGKNEVIKLKGIGIGATSDGPVATRDKNFFKDITYTWQESTYDDATGKWVQDGPTHTSNLNEIARNPDQIIAMLKEVYTNKSIPGNYLRSNAPDGTNDTYNTVLYTGVGQIVKQTVGPATAQVLDIAKYATITDAGATVSGMSSIYKYNAPWLTLSTYGAWQADANQNWLETSNMYNYSTNWSATDIFQGRDAYFNSSSGYNAIYGYGSQTYYVTNCVQVKAYTSSRGTAKLQIYECTLSDDGILSASNTASDTKSGNGVLTSANLDQTKIYKVQLTGGGNNPDLYEVGFKAGSLENEYSNDAYIYADSYGWDIPGTIEGSSYKYFKIDEYKPEEEGVTLLLMEMVDTFTAPADNSSAPTTHDYSQLRTYMANAIKSARVITDAKRTEQNQKSGTLFKIDCDKMNNFYLLAKGQLLGYNNGYTNHNYAYPHYYDGTWYDNRLSSSYLMQPAFLCHMFEQFSPEVDQGTPKEDLYAQMVNNMKSFAVEHDCPNVPYVNHHFKMYNSNYSGDCADVRDMMFFVPDNRMKYWSGRNDGTRALYHSYDTINAPTVGMYVIDQKEIKGTQETGKEMYKLTLTWDSNLDEFLPGDNQVYYLYQVVVDEDGTEQYKEVYYMNSDGKYTDKNGNVLTDQTKPVRIELEMSPSSGNKTYSSIYIPMLVNSQVVTFAVQGQDATKFLELKMSNTQDFVIPGLDPNEVVNLIDATHYSRFNLKTENNVQTMKNCYSNRIQMKNAGLTHSQIVTSGENASKLDIIRSYVKDDNTVDETIVATITFDIVTQNNQNKLQWTVNMNDDSQSAKSEYPNGATSGTAAGYHENTTLTGITTSAVTTTTPNPNINLGTNGILFYDNFTADVSQNTHPSAYSYRMESNIAGTPAVYLKTKNGTTDYTVDGAIWYAYTWNGSSNDWVKGVKTDKDGVYAFFYDSNHTNLLFARVNPNKINANGDPESWNSDVVWNQSQDFAASDGATFTVTGILTVTGPVAGSASVMHSNSYRVPVYKTDSKINNVYTLAEVNADNDGYHFENDDLTFQEKVQYSSKKDILRYDVYRWADGAEDWGCIIDKVVANNDNAESDISPNGQADNEDGWYTTKINAEPGENVTVPSGTTNWAVFVDTYPGSEESTLDEEGHAIQGLGIAQAFTYAPVVEVFGKGKTSNDLSKDRTDYNTYGAPLSSAAVGEFDLKEITNQDFQAGTDHALMSEHYWEKDGVKYSYYNIPLTITAKNVPAGYEIYKIRAWREIDPSVLGEEFAVFDKNGERDRMTPVKTGSDLNTYLFADITYPATQNISASLGSDTTSVTVDQVNQVSGEHYNHVITYTPATFGAKRVRTSDSETGVYDDPIDVGFFARIYFTRKANLASKDGVHTLAEGDLPADGKYYMVEADTHYTITPGSVITSLVQNLNTREVVGVKYYNTLGIESNTPFDGVNIVVTRYSDGSTSTTKILK